MKSAATIVYRDLEASDALNVTIHKKIEKLERLCNRASIQRVVINAPHHHQHKGSQFSASLELVQNGKATSLSHANDNVHLAVRDLFNAAERVVKEQSAKTRAKRHVDKDQHLEHDLDMAS